MNTLNTIYVSVFSLIILSILLVNVYNRTEKMLVQYRLFINLVAINMLLIIIDLLSWTFDQKIGFSNYILNNTFNLLLYVIEPIAGVLWIYYCDLQIFHDESRLKKMRLPLMVLVFINGAASVLSLFTGWLFYIDAYNIYHRGSYYWFHIILCYLLLIYASYIIFSNRHKIERRYYISLLFFPVPQAVGGILQAMFLGLSISWAGMTLSMLVTYFNIQNRGLNTDYLTGAYNRRQLDYYIKEKIRNSSEASSFSAMLMDLDKFKEINDIFGHNVGDDTLRATVELIRKCLRNNDFVARFGGDEFCIILDISDRKMLEAVVDRIKSSIDEYNSAGSKPYSISFSLGYDIYDFKSGQNYEEFLKHIDMLMYKNKNKRLA